LKGRSPPNRSRYRSRPRLEAVSQDVEVLKKK